VAPLGSIRVQPALLERTGLLLSATRTTVVAGSWNVIHCGDADLLLPPLLLFPPPAPRLLLAAVPAPERPVSPPLPAPWRDCTGVCGGIGHDMVDGDSAALLATLLAPRLLTLPWRRGAPNPPVVNGGSPACGRPLPAPAPAGVRRRPRDGSWVGCTGSVCLRGGAAKTTGMGEMRGFSDTGEVAREEWSMGAGGRAWLDFAA
jgi:hypothetical protein